MLVSTGKASVLQEKDGVNTFVTQKEMERQQKVLEEERKVSISKERTNYINIEIGKITDPIRVKRGWNKFSCGIALCVTG